MKIRSLIIVFFLLGCLMPAKASSAESWNAKDLLFGHIRDSYEWHICTIKGKSLSIPLPVILYSKHQGARIFLSSKIEEGKTYQSFQIAESGPNTGKIVEILADGKEAKPLDISITKNVLSLLFSTALLLWIFIGIGHRYRKRPLEKPSGMQALLEPLVLFVQKEIIIPAMPKDYPKFTPYLQTAFFFIFLNNLLGMIPFFPGGANLTGNIAVTLVLALITYVLTTIHGSKHYWKEIFWPDVPLFLKFPIPIFPFIEFFSTFSKPMALTIRLFANVLAGHMMILVLISLIFIMSAMNIWAGAGTTLISVPFSLFLSLLELLVAFIQAFVFTQLSALFIGLALEQGHAKESHK